MGSFVRRAGSALFSALAFISSILALATEAFATAYPGAIPATFNVGPQGAATYSIPIEAPAATGGIKPGIALTYNHLAGNGLAGVGWNLAGISVIVRCPQTHAVDGITRGFSYTSTDRYCLDGQRLVAYSGNYGQNGTEYRTELDKFARVFQDGTIGSTGASAFYVQLGDGRTAYYGYTSDSKIEKVGASAVRAWYLSYVEDQFGNRIYYAYSENTSTGEVVPTGVSWTSNASWGLSPKYEIEIVYETRPTTDQRNGHDMGGAPWASTKRIDRIDIVYNGSTAVATYELSYHSPVSTGTGRSQLSAVTQCRGSDCLPPTTFAVQNGTSGWGSGINTGKSAGYYGLLIADADNDGKQDLFAATGGTCPGGRPTSPICGHLKLLQP